MKITMEWLEEKGACRDGKKWFAAQPETDAATVCRKLLTEDHFDWANWTIVRCLERREQVLYACFAARKVLKIYEAKHPGDMRPRNAVETTEAWVKNPCKETRNAAAYAARGAAYAAAADAAAAGAAVYAADAAAYAAAADAAAAYAAYAAGAAVYAADAAYAAAADAAAARGAANAATKSDIIEYGIELLKTKGE